MSIPQPPDPAKPVLLAQGAYGCAYMPPLCVDTGDPEYAVGKLTYPQAVKTELEASKHIRQLPGYEKYFGVLTGNSCKPQITEEIKAQCKVAQKYPTVLVSYSSPYLGVSFHKFIDQQNILTDEWYYRKLAYLLMGLWLLQIIDYAHFDVKMDNILVDGNGVCRYIDFGLSVHNPRQRLSKNPERLGNFPAQFYSIYPIWYNVWIDQVNGTFKMYKSLDDIDPTDAVIYKYYKEYESYALFYDSSYVKWSATDPIKRIIFDSFKPDYFKRIIRPNIFKVDVYSLVSGMLSYINFSRKKPGYTLLAGQKMNCLTYVINRCMQLDARRVPTAEEALNILCNCNPSTHT